MNPDDEARLAQIEKRVSRATPGPWDVEPHAHGASGCRCLSCDEPAVGWVVDHPDALFCDDLVAKRSNDGEKNDFGRPLASCQEGPLLSFDDATFAAEAREDVPWLIAKIRELEGR